jgi:hypothetical protein
LPMNFIARKWRKWKARTLTCVANCTAVEGCHFESNASDFQKEYNSNESCD